MTILTPTTELDAVNVMLRQIGTSPATSLDAPSIDVEQALDTLRKISISVQSIGWDFNTEADYAMMPDTDGHIAVPPSLVEVRLDPVARQGWKYNIVTRSGKLYDRQSHSFTFTETLYTIVVILLDFPDLPQVARDYITIRAARMFADGVEGAQDAHQFSAQDELVAYAALQHVEAIVSEASFANNPDMAWSLNRYAYDGGF